MEPGKYIFDKTDYDDFKNWLQLNLDGITWQGKFGAEFEDFWTNFFIDGLNLSQLVYRFNYAVTTVKVGPISSWFLWLRDKFIVYVFIYREFTVMDIAMQVEISISELAVVLRNFFLEKLPHYDDEISELFQITNVSSENLSLGFKDIMTKLEIGDDFSGTHEDDVMPSMEITLYREWGTFVAQMKRDFTSKKFSLDKKKALMPAREILRLARDFVLLIVLGVVVITLVRMINTWYEEFLTNKISIYEPQFLQIDSNLKFKPFEEIEDKADMIDLDRVGIDLEDEDKFKQIEAEVFQTESEVVLASWESLPKDFDQTNLEQSAYEEQTKDGYRETRFGNKKVYRVMMRSVNAEESKKNLNELISKYSISQVDNVSPGTIVPGGLYYNLYVPRLALREFLTEVLEVDEAILYENLARGDNPPGVNKVFVWIKTI
ncbi:MAG: hypothetical protein A2504_10765 [Bdellovibrionales bacterium RIFOXYD12_FULL_39_22]|nr:MAG: hypothetical protein A2385_14400 [Bdellovibrionales bacterium RIFOXYB1_FULL_39_21]OFZ40423.1 MAG: hypothetical protein A2485_03090 [Bdellovibrionales bacterium RIFOXYC12_FULL_39_17]OFZ49672.1 MAG: hypothetical protein A2404_09550 [Bdellovibrionales bacterium RIFOXYC1_FULL_39_130]OFZ77342.1 MAG: hypothetical protein A2560_06215 [Bdellovibrionales bacterium RIFOXYD1_FULL_39_84]OFZ95997.1 MAG: hypothetical protein A2504_10765 [Bdellovibrionales bacterium RIFOXYD12_FULL_39_22]HLE11259.1 hy